MVSDVTTRRIAKEVMILNPHVKVKEVITMLVNITRRPLEEQKIRTQHIINPI